jgi:hypothetical protein
MHDAKNHDSLIIRQREINGSKVEPHGAVGSGSAMILCSAVVHGCVGTYRALFMLWIADEVYPWWIVKGWSHRQE